jgi:quercetin 2,3-dioxygenase
MPAVMVSDITTLDRIPEPGAEQAERAVRSVTDAPSGFEGEGFPVRRAFAGVPLTELDPFIHMDQMGEVEYAPGEPKGTAWHPHRGFETVTYIIDGTFEHADSHGGGGSITNGDTQWMTAGGGILHIERPPEALVTSGGLFHGLQLWVNLPRALKTAPPRYQDLRAGESALLASADGGALVRVIAGEVAGHRGRGSTHTPMAMLHATVSPGARLRLPWRKDFNALVYVLSGAGSVGPERRPVRTGQLAVFGPGEVITEDELAESSIVTVVGAEHQESRHPGLDVVVLGGVPIREPVAWGGPFVMNTRAEVLAAFEDFQAGRFGQVPAQRVPHGDLGSPGA